MAYWLAGDLLLGGALLAIGRVASRSSRWLSMLVVCFVVGDGLRALAGETGGLRLGSWALAYHGGLPGFVGYPLMVTYLSFFTLPLAMVLFGEQRGWQLASALLVADGLLHMLFPVQPPWMVGDSSRWAAQVPFARDILALDVSPVAALPSLHVALPFSQFLTARRPRLKQALGAYTLAVTLAVFLLGEHWLLDVVAGMLLVLSLDASLKAGSALLLTERERANGQAAIATE